LTKKFGNNLAVDDVSLTIYKGEMFGLVGADGAGKTTTIRTLCGLLNPTSGSVSVLGMDVGKNRRTVQSKIGYLSQGFSLYGDLSVDENLEFFAEIHNVRNYKKRREELLEFTRLKPFRNRPAEKLSGGMKQKLALACSLIHKPEILFLDEPTTGVDPISRRDFWKILSSLLRDGITILMSTPYLDEAERCSRVALMNRGKILKLGNPESIKKSMQKKVAEIVCKPVIKARDFLNEKFMLDVQTFGDRIDVVLPENFTADEIISALESAGFEVLAVRLKAPSLENVFIHLLEEFREGKNV
jgi:ABC-2 type transport system ATP-binding protein